MKQVLISLRAPLIAVLLIALLEYSIIQVTGDNQPCFLHDSVLGSILLWVMRLIFFIFCTILVVHMFLPKYTSLKSRMLEKCELEEKKKQAEERYWQQISKRAIKQLG